MYFYEGVGYSHQTYDFGFGYMGLWVGLWVSLTGKVVSVMADIRQYIGDIIQYLSFKPIYWAILIENEILLIAVGIFFMISVHILVP